MYMVTKKLLDRGTYANNKLAYSKYNRTYNSYFFYDTMASSK